MASDGRPFLILEKVCKETNRSEWFFFPMVCRKINLGVTFFHIREVVRICFMMLLFLHRNIFLFKNSFLGYNYLGKLHFL